MMTSCRDIGLTCALSTVAISFVFDVNANANSICTRNIV